MATFIEAKIGPSFPAECAAAGLSGLQFSFDANGVTADAALPKDKLEALKAVVAAHDATKPASPTVPDQVELYQFAGQAVTESIIPDADARAWLGQGVIPGKLSAALEQLLSDGKIDQERHDKAVYFLMGSKQIPRSHVLTPMLGAILGKDTPDKLDAFFVAAGGR